MNRRELLHSTALLSFISAVPASIYGAERSSSDKTPLVVNPLKPPTQDSIAVAFLISEGAVIIDFCGPWEVFESVDVPGRTNDAFRLYTVAESTSTIRASGGMKITPDYTFASAPSPKVIVIPAQSKPNEAVLEWIRKATKTTDVTMSVCTGAFLLAKTGLLSGKAATTHHGAYKMFAMQYPDINLKRGARWVENGNLASAGGLSSGIDLALRVVERYFGREVAAQTAYQGQGWMNPNTNEIYAKARVSTEEHPLCPVCDMEVNPATAVKGTYKGKTYYFCMKEHKDSFEASPEKFVGQD